MSAYTDHETRLRAALHAAADSLEPRGDGLERIRTRLRQPRPAFVTWAQPAVGDIAMRARAWLQDVAYQVAGWYRLAAERFAPAQAPGRHRSRPQSLLRPLAAMAVVMFIVAAGTYVAIDASTGIFPSSSSGLSSNGAPRSAGHHNGQPGIGAVHDSRSQSGPGAGKPGASASPSCTPTAKTNATTPAAQPSSGTSSSPAASPPDASASPGPSATPGASGPLPTDTTGTSSTAASPAASAAAPPPDTSSPQAGLVPKSSSC